MVDVECAAGNHQHCRRDQHSAPEPSHRQRQRRRAQSQDCREERAAPLGHQQHCRQDSAGDDREQDPGDSDRFEPLRPPRRRPDCHRQKQQQKTGQRVAGDEGGVNAGVGDFRLEHRTDLLTGGQLFRKECAHFPESEKVLVESGNSGAERTGRKCVEQGVAPFRTALQHGARTPDVSRESGDVAEFADGVVGGFRREEARERRQRQTDSPEQDGLSGGGPGPGEGVEHRK